MGRELERELGCEESNESWLEGLIKKKRAEARSSKDLVKLSILSQTIPQFSPDALVEMRDYSSQEIRQLASTFPRSNTPVPLAGDRPDTALIRAALFIHTSSFSGLKNYYPYPAHTTQARIRNAFRYCLAQCVLQPSATIEGLYYRSAEKLLDRAKSSGKRE